MILPFNNVMNKTLSACYFFLPLYTFNCFNFNDGQEIQTSILFIMYNTLLNVERD
jgi:hypothetical protein